MIKYNLNNEVSVKLTEKGILHYMEVHNMGLPLKYHLSYSEIENRKNKEGYHVMQFHQLLEYFGGLGFNLPKYIELNILLHKEL